MIAYFDASALVKLVVEEPGSQQAAELWDAADLVLASRVTEPEVRAALAAAHRAHRLTDRGFAGAKAVWEDFCDGLRVVELTAEVASLAGELAEEHALGGLDAVHLASASLLAHDQPTVATWDRRLHAATQRMQLQTFPEVVSD